ncbi:MAG: hypothetical protein O6768_04970 [Planctomycetota bacterium]|nr:hypothetical protein [Planctomycetota bacterium]
MSRPTIHRRGFTLLELLLAGLVTALVLGAVTISLSQFNQAKAGGKTRLQAYLRADTALNALRRDIASVLRDDDLFLTRLLVVDGSAQTGIGHVDRDEILLFNTRFRPIRNLDFIGEGMEYETQFRIEEDDGGAVLWQRRSAMPDEYPRGGGLAVPLVDGMVALAIEAYDGDLWYEQWDSDIDGLPLAIRVTVTAHSDRRNGDDLHTTPAAVLRTVIPIDRVLPPPSPLLDDSGEGADLDQGQDATGEGVGSPGDDRGGAPGGFRGGGRSRGGGDGAAPGSTTVRDR